MFHNVQMSSLRKVGSMNRLLSLLDGLLHDMIPMRIPGRPGVLRATANIISGSQHARTSRSLGCPGMLRATANNMSGSNPHKFPSRSALPLCLSSHHLGPNEASAHKQATMEGYSARMEPALLHRRRRHVKHMIHGGTIWVWWNMW